MISDPAQLLQRIPELEPLGADPKIRKAIEGGDPFKVYRALFRAKWLRKLPAHAATLTALLRQRRLFAKPLKGSPGLGTLNGFGLSFVGSSDRDKDGTFIALHALVFLFAIPVIPLGSYIVKSEGRSGLSSRWRIYARVPTGTAGWLYSRGLAAAMAGLIVFGLGESFWASRNQDVTIINGFDKPLLAQIAGTQQTIPAQGRMVVNVPAGHVTGSAKLANGTLVDRLSVEVHSEAVHAVWNIAGAAPLYRETAIYRAQGESQPGGEQNGEIFCGRQYAEFDSIDYAFETPPAQLQGHKNDGPMSKTHLDVLTRPGVGQSTLCMSYLASKNQFADGAAMLEALAAISGWESQATGLAVLAAGLKSHDAAVALAKRVADSKPDDVDLQRLYIRVLDLYGMIDRARAESAQRARRQPDSPVAQYLGAIEHDGEDGVGQLDALAQKFKEPYILRSLVWREWVNGHHDRAASDFDRLQGLAPKEASYVVDADIGAQLALHQPARAMKAIEDGFAASKEGNTRVTLASDYALVANANGGVPETLFARIGQDEIDPAVLAYYRARAGLAPDPKFVHDGAFTQMAMDLRDNPAAAVGLAARLGAFDVFRLSREHWAILYAEALRTSDQALQDKLVIMSDLDADARERLKAFVRGQNVKLDGVDISPEARAAACLVRSQNASLSLAERRSLREDAAKGDLMKTVVSTAARQWTL